MGKTYKAGAKESSYYKSKKDGTFDEEATKFDRKELKQDRENRNKRKVADTFKR